MQGVHLAIRWYCKPSKTQHGCMQKCPVQLKGSSEFVSNQILTILF